jgi:hypothetical protein
MSARSRHDAG